ncbi:heme o synthase, partial [Planctomycetota bacterium]|nr:heme o synthase [Planctomycetota bacterium]
MNATHSQPDSIQSHVTSARLAPVAVTAPHVGWATWLRGFGALTKFRLSSLVLFTTAIGFVLADPVVWTWSQLLGAMFGTALAAFGANALNQAIEAPHDRLMKRTRNRPVPAGVLSVTEAFVFGAGLAVAGPLLVAVTAGGLPAALTLLTVLLYVAVYTPLKRVTSLNTQIGAVCGALPPVIGWTAVSGAIEPGACVLFAILLIWQIPHFLAIDWMHKDDYGGAGYRMLSSVDRSGRLNGTLAVV